MHRPQRGQLPPAELRGVTPPWRQVHSCSRSVTSTPDTLQRAPVNTNRKATKYVVAPFSLTCEPSDPVNMRGAWSVLSPTYAVGTEASTSSTNSGNCSGNETSPPV